MHLSAGSFHLLALFWTLSVEAAGMTTWARIAYPQIWRATGCCLATNLVAHTLFWYSQPFFALYGNAGLFLAEGVVILLEGAVYWRVLSLSGVTPWLLSTFLNLASLVTGLWLWQAIL
jgi:hypothetical protein